MANDHSQIVPSMQPTSTVADFKFWCQKVLPLVYDDSISYYEVLGKMVVYLNQVIDNINATTANVAELEDDFLLLQNYVNNFFDDIDQLVTYTERAEAAQTAAAASAISAASSASNSATSASNSAGSASSAATSALSALDAKDAAVAAKTAAETALANAQTAATNAANSATAASGSATNAAASATAAQQSFTLADAARTAAQSAATSAESDAEDAADSAAEAVAAVDTIINGLGNITKTIENVPIATTEDALASIAKKLVVDIEPIQSGSGDPSPTNIRPITGWTGANVVRTGKNLLALPDADFTLDGLRYYTVNGRLHIDGTTTAETSSKNLTFESNLSFTLKAGTYYFYLTDYEHAVYLYHRVDGVITNLATNAGSFTLQHDDTVWVGFYMYRFSFEDYVVPLMLVSGSSVPPYEPYSGTTYTITFPDAAGTVYGGTLTHEGGEWKLRVTHGGIGFDGSSDESWSISGDTNNNQYIIFVEDCLVTPSPNNYYGLLSNILPEITGADGYDNNNIYGVSLWNGPNSQIRISIPVNIVNRNVNDFKTWLSNNPVFVYYPLATPVEYNLTESQALALLNGINNVWADTGNINTLEYFTNAENYVTSQIDSAKSLIAPVLKEMKADTALVANDFRIVGNTLYRITGNIASGGTLTPNTNCVATTVGAILKSLLSA